MSEGVFVTIGGEQISVSIEGGNMAAGASVAFGDLNQAVSDAEQAAADSATSAAQASTAGALAGAAAGASTGASAGSAAGTTAGTAAGTTAGTAAANVVVASKADIGGGNITDAGSFRANINNGPSVLDYIPKALRPAILAGTSTVDVADYVETAFRAGVGLMDCGKAQFTISRQITVPAADGLAIRGSDKSLTTIRLVGSTSGIILTYSDTTKPPSISGLTIAPTSAGQSNGLTVNGAYSVSVTRYGPFMRNVDIGSGNSNYFTNPLILSRVWYPQWTGLTIKGGYDGSFTYPTVRGITLDRVQAPSGDAVVYHCDIGIGQIGNEVTPGAFGEGVNFAGSEIVGVRIGIDLIHNSAVPGTSVHDLHINATECCIRATNHQQTVFHDLLLYKTGGTANWRGVDLIAANNCMVHHVVAGGDGASVAASTDTAVYVNTSSNVVVDTVTAAAFGGPIVGVRDDGTNTDLTIQNVRPGTANIGAWTGAVLTAGSTRTDARDIYPLVDQLLTVNSATPSVATAQHRGYRTNNSSATALSNFTGGIEGQELFIVSGDSNTSILSNANIILNGGGGVSPLSLPAGSLITLVRQGSVWRQFGTRTSP